MTDNLSYEIAVVVEKKRAETNIKHLLIDLLNSRNIAAVHENDTFAYQNKQEFNLDRSAKVAFLTAASDHSHDFVETVMRNAGHNMRRFNERHRLA